MKRDVGGELIGVCNTNPKLDTRAYEDVFPSGKEVEVLTNVLAESIFTSCDEEGNNVIIFIEIIDHQSDKKAIRKENGLYINQNNLHII